MCSSEIIFKISREMDYQAMRTVPLFIINLPRVCYNLQAHESIVGVNGTVASGKKN